MFIDNYFPLHELKSFLKSMKMVDAKQGRYFKRSQKSVERIIEEMDAKEFVKDIRRMCEYYEDCVECPNRECGYCSKSGLLADDEAEEIISIVDKWAKEHPVETNQTKLLELFPNLKLNANGTVDYCPKTFGANCECIRMCVGNRTEWTMDCLVCKNKFWNSEYKVK